MAQNFRKVRQRSSLSASVTPGVRGLSNNPLSRAYQVEQRNRLDTHDPVDVGNIGPVRAAGTLHRRLVIAPLEQAIASRWRPGIVHHSDRGFT